MIKPARMKRMELIPKEVTWINIVSTYAVCTAEIWKNNFCISWNHFYHLIGMTEKFFVLYWCLCVSVCFSHLSFQKWKMIEWTLPYSPYCIFLHIYFLKMSVENTGISETINWKIFSGSKPQQPLVWSAFGSLTFLRVHKPSKPCTYSVGYHYYHSHEGKKSHEQWQGCLTI